MDERGRIGSRDPRNVRARATPHHRVLALRHECASRAPRPTRIHQSVRTNGFFVAFTSITTTPIDQSRSTPPRFAPLPQDQDGLSFFRERLISAEQVARSARQPAENYIVARYRAGDLFDLGLTLTPTNDSDDPPGHVVVIELGNSGYNENRRLCKERHKRLAELGSRDVIKGFSGP